MKLETPSLNLQPPNSQLEPPNAERQAPNVHQPPSLSIVIITRNTRDLLQQLLRSIEADTSLQQTLAEVIVMDNGSTDGTGEMVKDCFSQVIHVENSENRGFGASANMGFSRSTGDYVAFLNSDTIVMEGEILKLVRYADGHEKVGICGPQLVYEDMRPQRSFAFVPCLLFEVVPRSLLERLFPKRFVSGGKRQSDASAILPSPLLKRGAEGGLAVESLIGAAIVVRRSTFQTLNGFDERFFFFLEETDLCLRARGLGREVVFCPDARVVHLQGKTVRKNWIQGRIEYNISLYKFIGKHHGSCYFAAFAGLRFLKCVLFLVALTIMPPLLLRKRIRMSAGYYRNLFLWHLKGCPDNMGLKSIPRE